MNIAPRPRLRILPLLAVLAFTGCATKLTVTVDGYARPDTPARPGKYLLTTGNASMPESDLQYQSHAARVENALGAAGWTRVTDRKDADTLIRFRWSVSDPLQEIREYDTPDFAPTGYHRVVTRPVAPGGGQVAATTVHMTPVYNGPGYTRHTDTRLSYGLRITLEAYDLAHPAPDGTPPQLWKTLVSTRDTHGDLRTLLPELLRAAAPYIGTDTSGQREIEITAPERP